LTVNNTWEQANHQTPVRNSKDLVALFGSDVNVTRNLQAIFSCNFSSEDCMKHSLNTSIGSLEQPSERNLIEFKKKKHRLTRKGILKEG
jgi:hypothetical protein